MNHYISEHPHFSGEGLEDIPQTQFDEDILDTLLEKGIPMKLAKHFARLFAHDALVIFEGHTEFDEEETEHFEQFQSTNWNSMRFKPPPTFDSNIGW